jgi:hypothetical protein
MLLRSEVTNPGSGLELFLYNSNIMWQLLSVFSFSTKRWPRLR